MEKKRPVKRWLGAVPEHCDICKKHLLNEEAFYNSRMIDGPWGIFCPECHKNYCHGIGTGLGQKYDTKTLEKIGG